MVLQQQKKKLMKKFYEFTIIKKKKRVNSIGKGITCIVLKSDPVRQVDSRLKPGWIEEKTGEEKTRCDPVTQLTRQDPVKNSVATR
jgi:hypothetical protein